MQPPSRILYPLLLVATAINLLGLPFAVARAEPWHATLHAALALAGGFWALRLRHRRRDGHGSAGPAQAELEAGERRGEIVEGEEGVMEGRRLKDRPAP